MNNRVIPAAVMLLPAWGCHVFSDGTIEQTCDEIAGCVGDGGAIADGGTAGDGGGDGGDPGDLEWDVGVSLSTTRSGQWRATAFSPPDLLPELDRAGSGEGLAGPAAYDADDGVLWVLTDGMIFGIGSGSAVVAEPTPVDGAVDICFDDGALFLAADGVLVAWRTSNGAARKVEPPGGTEWEQVGQVFPSENRGDIYFIELGGTAPDLWRYSSSLDRAEIVYEDYDTTGSRSGAGGFLGPEDEPYVCSITGAIYKVADLAAAAGTSDSPKAVTSIDANVTDVVACGWAPSVQRYLVFSASAGVLAIADGEEEMVVVDPTFGTIAGGDTW